MIFYTRQCFRYFLLGSIAVGVISVTLIESLSIFSPSLHSKLFRNSEDIQETIDGCQEMLSKVRNKDSVRINKFPFFRFSPANSYELKLSSKSGKDNIQAELSVLPAQYPHRNYDIAVLSITGKGDTNECHIHSLRFPDVYRVRNHNIELLPFIIQLIEDKIQHEENMLSVHRV